MAQAVEGHGPGGTFILGQGAVQPNERLELLNCLMGLLVIGSKW